jgi:hypothetical protein
MLVMQDLAAFLDLPEAPKPEGLRGRKISLPTQESGRTRTDDAYV